MGLGIRNRHREASAGLPGADESTERNTMKLHTSTYPLTGSDDRLVKVAVDRAVGQYGGIWIEYRIGPEHPTTEWDASGYAGILPTDLRNMMRGAAIKAHVDYKAGRR